MYIFENMPVLHTYNLLFDEVSFDNFDFGEVDVDKKS
jgi:hypothetical protein